jgi:hypothetical protein
MADLLDYGSETGAFSGGDEALFTKCRATVARLKQTVLIKDVQGYDIFISHAPEDKVDFVEPLAQALKDRGLRPWYDRFELRPGDSLSKTIDEGLASSQYGIVVLSKHFFQKAWPESEYRALLARQNASGERRLIPVWHGVSRDEIERFSPLLLDIFAVDSKHGIQSAVSQIASVVRPEAEPAGAAAPVLSARYEEYDLAPYKIGDPGAPQDALPWQPFFSGQQPCLDLRFGEPQSVDIGSTTRWSLSCAVTNVGVGAARTVRLFLPYVTVFAAQLIERDKTVPLSLFVDDRVAFWKPIRPMQTVFEYEDVSGILYRQYGTMHQEATPGGAIYKFSLFELGKPFRVKNRIVDDQIPKAWLMAIPQ